MSLPPAARGLKIPYVVRNDWQSRGLAMAAALTCYKQLIGLGGATDHVVLDASTTIFGGVMAGAGAAW